MGVLKLPRRIFTMTNTTLKSEAKTLAESHRKMDSGTHIAKFFPSKDNDVIRLLEVSSSVATSGIIEPFLFDKDTKTGLFHPCEIILLSDHEWDGVLNNELHLPDGWDVQSAEELLA